MLNEIVKQKKQEVRELKDTIPLSILKEKLKNSWIDRDFRRAIVGRKGAIIAEFKRHSPSAGNLGNNRGPVEMAKIYEENGASAISVLTDRTFFHATPGDLTKVKEHTNLPVLRKDFLIDAYQIYESKLLGADAVLLISTILSEETLSELMELCQSLSMDPLVEVHEGEDLEKALKVKAEIIGINNRNLNTFATDINQTLKMVPLIPPGKIIVSESGIRTTNDLNRLKKAGIRAFLVGETLLKAPDPGKKLKEFLAELEDGN